MKHTALKQLIISAQFAVLIAIIAQFSLPLGLIPLTGQTLAIGLTATILGPKNSLSAIGLYLLMGLIGLPVFANHQAGLAVLFGPTGGYLIGFLFYGLIASTLLSKTNYDWRWAFIANWLGSCAALIIGTLWLKVSVDLTLVAAFKTGMVAFLIPELIKASLATGLGLTIRKALLRAKLQLD